MKKFMFAVMLLLGLSMITISCFGSDNKIHKGKTDIDESYQESPNTDFPENLCKSILTRLYNDYVFGNRSDQFGQVVDELFTKKAKQKLIDAYDYECDDVCYAIWELRTNAQDSKDNEEGSHITDIRKMVGNTYEVHYFDNGWEGTTMFLFASENGKVKINDFIGWEDESHGASDMLRLVFDDQCKFVGFYVFTDGSNYVTDNSNYAREYREVPISSHRIVSYSAEKGQGRVCSFHPTVNVKKDPTFNSTVVSVMIVKEGYSPENYLCLGKENGWYKIRIDEGFGYVTEDSVSWVPNDDLFVSCLYGTYEGRDDNGNTISITLKPDDSDIQGMKFGEDHSSNLDYKNGQTITWAGISDMYGGSDFYFVHTYINGNEHVVIDVKRKSIYKSSEEFYGNRNGIPYTFRE